MIRTTLGAVLAIATATAPAQICNVRMDYKWNGITVSLVDHDGITTDDVFTRNTPSITFGTWRMNPIVPGPVVKSTQLPNGQVQVVVTNLEIVAVGGPDSAELIICADWKHPPLPKAQVSIRAKGSTIAAMPANPDDSAFSLDFVAEIDGANLAAGAQTGGFTGNSSFDLDKDGVSNAVGAGPHKLRAVFGFSWTHPVDKIILPDSFIITLGPCTADVNGDGIIDNGDIQEFVTRFLGGNLSVDLNNDGILDSADIQEFVAAFLAGC